MTQSKKSKLVTVHTDEASGDGFLKLEDLKDFVDTSKVDSYKLEEVLDADNKPVGLILKLYDKDGNILK